MASRVELKIGNRQSAIGNLFLIGYRGSGKTTVARLLAARLGWGWLDADEELVRRQGRSIRALFAEEGEAGFRDREAQLLAELSRLERYVIATGGGVVLLETNRRLIKETGLAVWLTADAATLGRRLELDACTTEQRPALTVGGLAEIEDLLRQRRPWYEACADLTIDTVGRSAEEVAAAILTHLTTMSFSNRQSEISNRKFP